MIQSVDIAICTWNRAALLAQTLEAIGQLEIPTSLSWRVLIVDNHSTDETEEVLEQFADRLPLVGLKEPVQGHTFARNRAVAASRGDLILWTDDDVLVPPHWLKTYLATANSDAARSFWGGQIEPVFPEGQPVWIRENWSACAGCFAARDLGPESVEFNPSRLPYGANFAIRGELQRRFPFDTELGRRGGNVLGDDELDLFRRLLAAGHQGAWIPGNGVRHQISSERATPEFVYQYYVGQGAAMVRNGSAWPMARWQLRWVYLWHSLAYETTRYVARSPRWFAHLARAGLALGQWRAQALAAQKQN